METIVFEMDQGIAKITMNRPERLNAYIDQMGKEFLATIRELEEDDSVRALIITGAGSAFCAGRDLRVGPSETLGMDASQNRAGDIHRGYRRSVAKLVKAIHGLDFPTIASVNGAAVGLGCDLALACDVRIGSDKARFREAWIEVAGISGGGASWLLPRVVGLGVALDLLYTARMVEADEALRIGLLSRLVPAGDLASETMAFAQSIVKHSPIALKLYKINVYKGLNMDLPAAFELAATSQAVAATTRDFEENEAARKAKRKPVFHNH